MIIITVNHDARRFIELCIKAVHLRTKSEHRHLVIDNGSNPDVIRLLQQFAAKQWIEFIPRTLPKKASSHASSLDWFLRSPNRRPEWVCLLDSDAYPVADGWLSELKKRAIDNDVQAVGFSHFRDGKLLHPSCMLFRYDAYVRAGKPSFAIVNSHVFNDTGMIVCEKMVQTGSKLLPYSKEDLYQIVRHRWCGTRIENARGDKLDGIIPKSDFEQESREWLSQPEAVEALNHH